MANEQFDQTDLLVKKKIRKLRMNHKLTQEEVAKMLGLSAQHYQRVEAPESSGVKPSLKVLKALADKFNVHISYFFSEDELEVVSTDGSVVADDLSIEDIVALRNAKDLSPEDKKEIAKFIRFKKFEAKEREESGDIPRYYERKTRKKRKAKPTS